MDALPTKRLKTNSAENCPVNPEQCIICQVDTGQKLTNSENGRKKIIEASMIRRDQGFEKLELIDNNNFSHHMSNDCYRCYTLKKSPEGIQKARSSIEDPPAFLSCMRRLPYGHLHVVPLCHLVILLLNMRLIYIKRNMLFVQKLDTRLST